LNKDKAILVNIARIEKGIGEDGKRGNGEIVVFKCPQEWN